MNRFIKSLVIVFGISLLVATAFGFVWSTPVTPKPAHILSVVTSFYPLAEMAEKVGGQHVVVKNMLPPGGEPHDFAPMPRDLAELGRADLFLYNGAHFEPWIEKWASSAFTRPRFTLSLIDELEHRGVPLVKKDDAIIDPHVWVSPMVFMREVEVVRDALVDIDPANAADYQVNAERYLSALSELDRYLREGLIRCEKKDAVVSHEAFAYLGRDYGFSLIPIAGISPDEEPSPKALAEVARIARAKGLPYIFFETNVSPKLSQTIAREAGAGTLTLNPIESLTEDDIQSGEDYISTMLANLNNLRKALICL